MFSLIVKSFIALTFAAYVIPLLYIFFYSLIQTNLVVFYLLNKEENTPGKLFSEIGHRIALCYRATTCFQRTVRCGKAD